MIFATRSPQAAGFTLLELLVAISVFAVLSVVAYGGLFSVLETSERVSEHMSDLERLQMADFWLTQDLEQIAPRPIRDEYGEPRPALLLESDGGSLEFTRAGRANPAHWARSDLQRVAYVLQDRQLLRRSWSVLDRAQDSSATEALLLTGVESWQWRFLDRDFAWQEDWQESSDSASIPPLPHALALTLETRRWGPVQWVFELPPGLPERQDEAQSQ